MRYALALVAGIEVQPIGVKVRMNPASKAAPVSASIAIVPSQSTVVFDRKLLAVTVWPAPSSDLVVMLTSRDPSRLLLSDDERDQVEEMRVTIAAGTTAYAFYVRSLRVAGVVIVAATASGYGSATASVTTLSNPS